jgi:Domain of unknown function (DUF4214)
MTTIAQFQTDAINAALNAVTLATAAQTADEIAQANLACDEKALKAAECGRCPDPKEIAKAAEKVGVDKALIARFPADEKALALADKNYLAVVDDANTLKVPVACPVPAAEVAAITPASIVSLGDPEFQGMSDLAQAARLYVAAFDRAPDAGGLDYWTNAMRHGMTQEQVATDFLATPEGIARLGADTIPAFVNQLYENVLGRAADVGGKAFWTSAIEGGQITLGGTLAAFANSREFAHT